MAFDPRALITALESNGRSFTLPHEMVGNCACWSEAQNGFLFSCGEGILVGNEQGVKLPVLRPGRVSSSMQMNRAGSMLLETCGKTVFITKIQHRKPDHNSVTFPEKVLK